MRVHHAQVFRQISADVHGERVYVCVCAEFKLNQTKIAKMTKIVRVGSDPLTLPLRNTFCKMLLFGPP